MEHPENYTFKYTELPPASSAASESRRFGYITEENRNKLNNGDILRLALTPPIAAEGVYTKAKTKSGDEKTKAVTDLLKLSKDYAFALEFIKLDGITCLTGLVEASQLVNELEIMQLTNAAVAIMKVATPPTSVAQQTQLYLELPCMSPGNGVELITMSTTPPLFTPA